MCEQPPEHMQRCKTVYPSIYLEYGIDGLSEDDTVCEICARGMRFKTRWRFELFSALKLTFVLGEIAPIRLEVEAMVVEIAPHPESGQLVLLAFIDPPEEFRQQIGKIAAQVTFSSPAKA